MIFKETKNLKTGKKTYYIDGKRVSRDKFDLISLVQQRAGKQYNSSITYAEGMYRYSSYCYD